MSVWMCDAGDLSPKGPLPTVVKRTVGLMSSVTAACVVVVRSAMSVPPRTRGHFDGLRRNSHNSKSYYKSCILSANILCAPAEAAFGG